MCAVLASVIVWCNAAGSGMAAEVEVEEAGEEGWGDDADLILEDGENIILF